MAIAAPEDTTKVRFKVGASELLVYVVTVALEPVERSTLPPVAVVRVPFVQLKPEVTLRSPPVTVPPARPMESTSSPAAPMVKVRE